MIEQMMDVPGPPVKEAVDGWVSRHQGVRSAWVTVASECGGEADSDPVRSGGRLEARPERIVQAVASIS